MTAKELLVMYEGIFINGPDVFRRLTKENSYTLSDYEID